MKDVDLDRYPLRVRCRNGEHDRAAPPPTCAHGGLRALLDTLRDGRRSQLAAKRGAVDLPSSLRSRMPGAATSLAGQHLFFPASPPCPGPATGRMVGHHVHVVVVQKPVRTTTTAAGIDRRATCHTLRPSFATHLLEAGADLHTIQPVPGRKDARTAMIDTPIVDRGPAGVASALDR